MFIEMSKRSYTKRQRAEREAGTRARIVEAVVALHEEVGPRDTTISAIAERAGVQRLTVYRHFPDERALLDACTSRWLEDNPPPDPSAWSRRTAPAARSRAALAALYGYYGRTADMWRRAYRDVDDIPALARAMSSFETYLGGVRDDLTAAWKPRGARRSELSACVGAALRFATWQALDDEGLDDAAKARLVERWFAAAAGTG